MPTPCQGGCLWRGGDGNGAEPEAQGPDISAVMGSGGAVEEVTIAGGLT